MSEAPRPIPSARQPVFNAPPLTAWTCGALVLLHFLLALGGPAWQNTALRILAFVPADFLALFTGQGPAPSPLDLLPLLGHGLLHADVTHLLLNAGFLLAFGSAVERRLGSARFAIVFIVATAAGALAELTADHAREVYVIGASDAVYGMLGAAIPIMFRAGLPARRRRALEFIAVIMALNLMLAAFGPGTILTGGEIAWRAHVGGFLAGLLLGLALAPRRPRGP